MKIEEVEGIVLGETNYSESSKILNILTEKYGIIGVMSKGCRKMKSKLRGVSRKMIYADFHIYYKENGLSTLIEVDVKNSFSNILTDLTRVSYASYIIDLVNQVGKENPSCQIFPILKDSLIKMNDGLDSNTLTAIVEIKLLDFLGVKPMIDACSICGSTKDIITINSTAGGYICKNCYHDEGIVSDKTIKLLRMFYYVDIASITKLDIKEETLKEINQFLDDYYDRYTGMYLKSKNFLRELKKINQV